MAAITHTGVEGGKVAEVEPEDSEQHRGLRLLPAHPSQSLLARVAQVGLVLD